MLNPSGQTGNSYFVSHFPDSQNKKPT